MLSFVLWTVLAQQPIDPRQASPRYEDPPPISIPAAPSGRPLTQMRAWIDARGNLTITYLTSTGSGPVSQEITVKPPEKPGDEKVPVKAKVKVTSLMVMTTELPAKNVDAYTVDGKPLTAEKLATLLEKERTVLVALEGEKIDPFLLELYKEGTIVLVPPANTINMGYGVYGRPYGYGEPVRPLPVTPKEPEPRPTEPRDRDREPTREP